MGGTNSQPVSNTYAIKIESQGLSESPFDKMTNQYQAQYKTFVDSLLLQSSNSSLKIISKKETLYLGCNNYLNNYLSKNQLRGQVENFIISTLKIYVNYTFCIALSRTIEKHISKALRHIQKQQFFSQINSHLVLGDSGTLFKVNYQIGFKYASKNNEDDEDTRKNAYIAIFNGIAAVKVQDQDVQQIIQKLQLFLKNNKQLQLDNDIKNRFKHVYQPPTGQAQVLQGGQVKQSKLQKYGKTAFSIMEKIALAMSMIKPFVIKQQTDGETKEGGQFTNSYSKILKEQKPQATQSPLWRVGRIIATFTNLKQKNKQDQCFTGTILDEYNILTSPNILLKAKEQKKDYQLTSLAIQIEGEQFPRPINLSMINLDNLVEDKHLMLFLVRPLGQHYPRHKRFVVSFVEDPSILHAIQNNPIYMCGYVKEVQEYKQHHQVSKVINLYQTHFFEAFRKNQYSIGAPIYYCDQSSIFMIFGITHSKQNIQAVFNKKITKEEKLKLVTKAASQFIQKNWFHIRTKYDLAKATFNKSSAQTKEYIYDKHPQKTVESLQYQIQNRRIRAVSCVHSIGVIEITNSFGTNYELGVQIVAHTAGQKEQKGKSNTLNLLTLSKYVEDKTSGFRVYIKKFVQTVEDPLDFDLNRTSKYNIYVVTKIKRGKQFSLLELKNDATSEILIRAINQNQLKTLYPLSGFIISIDKEGFGKRNLKLKITGLGQHNMLKTYTEDYYKENPFDEGLLFASQHSPLNWVKYYEFFYGFYNKVKFEQNINGRILKMFDKQKQIFQSIGLSNLRTELGPLQSEKQPYRSIGIIISKFGQKNPIIRVGTCSVIKSKSAADEAYIITCAHNLVYSSSSEVISLEKDPKNNVKILIGKDSRIQWTFATLTEKLNQTKQIIQSTFVHPDYIKQVKKPTAVQSGQYRRQSFFDIAIIKVKFTAKEDKPQGFVIKPNRPADSPNFIKNIEVAGYPAQENQYGSKFGLLYHEIVKDHEEKDQPNCYTIIQQKPELIIKHKLSTLSGNSGSPIFYPTSNSNDQHALLGVHIAGVKQPKQTYNLGSYIYNPKIWSWINKFEGIIDK